MAPQCGSPERADVEVTAILATEPHPPAGEEPVEWLLLTNLPVETPEQAIEKLQGYLCRWQIEIDQPYCLLKSLFAFTEHLNHFLRPPSWHMTQLA